jgi:glycosyltransferase involved in cell wall biosynthesis
MSLGTKQPRMLIFAYACEPARGSEPAAGWGLVQAAREIADCTVLVGPEHSQGIDLARTMRPSHNVSFVEIPEPWWAPLAQRHRMTRFLTYISWLSRARRAGLRLHSERPFDLTYHATYSTYWLPSPATSFGVPSIWGPVGGAVETPLRLWPILGLRGVVGELVDLVAVRALSMLPATRQTWRQATVRLVQNEATLGRLPKRIRERARIMNHAPFAEVPPIEHRPRESEILFVGPLQARKGARLAVRALVQTPETVRLTIIGDGPERRALQALARRLGVAARIQFKGRLPHPDVFRNLATCAAVVFTGLREEGGIALAEAMLAGVPVIVLAHGGARTIAAAATDPSRVLLIQPASIALTARRLGEAMARFAALPSSNTGPTLDQTDARCAFRDAVREALTLPSRLGESTTHGAVAASRNA